MRNFNTRSLRVDIRNRVERLVTVRLFDLCHQCQKCIVYRFELILVVILYNHHHFHTLPEKIKTHTALKAETLSMKWIFLARIVWKETQNVLVKQTHSKSLVEVRMKSKSCAATYLCVSMCSLKFEYRHSKGHFSEPDFVRTKYMITGSDNSAPGRHQPQTQVVNRCWIWRW